MVDRFKIFIEIDGPYHENQSMYDAMRTERIYEETGFKVIRFKNAQVLRDPEDVLATLQDAFSKFDETGYHLPP